MAVQVGGREAGRADFTGRAINRQEREAARAAATPTTSGPTETQGALAQIVQGLQQKQEPTPRRRAAAPAPAPQAAPRAREVAAPTPKGPDAAQSVRAATKDIRSFVRPGTGSVGSFVRKSARLGAFDPRQRTQGAQRRASDEINAPGQTVSGPVAVAGPTPSSVLPSQGFNPRQFEEDERLLGVLGG